MSGRVGVLVALLILWLAAGAVLPVVAQGGESVSSSAGPWRGLTLAAALARLERAGLPLVFTSELVRPDQRVSFELHSSEPREQLAELLAPHGLRAEERAGGVLVVVKASVPEALPPPTTGSASDVTPLRQPIFEEEIVVRSSQVSLLDETPSAPLALSRSEIEALPHLAQDLFRSLSVLPGTTGNDYTAQFHVRGGRRDEVQLLLDGQELFEAFHLQDFDRALSVVAPAGVGGAALATGSFAAVHGDRMSGVLDLRTSESTGEGRTELSLDVLNVSGTSAGRFAQGRAHWLASARRGSTEVVDRFLGTERPTFWDLFGKVGWDLSAGHSLRLHTLVASDGLETREVEDEDRKTFLTDYDAAHLWLRHQGTVAERALVETRVSWAEFDRDRRGLEFDEEKRAEVVDLRSSTVATLGQTWNLETRGGQSLEAGFEARRYRSRFDYRNNLEARFRFRSPELAPRDVPRRFAERIDGDHLGTYVSHRFIPIEPVTAELGLRYDHHSLTEEATASPRLHVAWRPDHASVVRLGWGVYRQSQRPYELAVEDGESKLSRSERSDHLVLGYERAFGDEGAALSALRIEAYDRRVRHPRPHAENLFEAINTFQEIEPDRVRLVPDESWARGLEVLVRGSLGDDGRWWANYAFARAREQVGRRELARATDQAHSLNLYWGTRLGKHWDVSAVWRFHTGWPTTTVQVVAEQDEEGELDFLAVLGPIYGERLPNYHRLDLRASREWQWRSGRLTFFFDLQNVYDHENVAGFDLAFDEDDGTLEIEPENWPGLFPSLGVTWEF